MPVNFSALGGLAGESHSRVAMIQRLLLTFLVATIAAALTGEASGQ
jgi:hypothetical protein